MKSGNSRNSRSKTSLCTNAHAAHKNMKNTVTCAATNEIQKTLKILKKHNKTENTSMNVFVKVQIYVVKPFILKKWLIIQQIANSKLPTWQ